MANTHGFWHIQGALSLKELPLQGVRALPARTVPPVSGQVLLPNSDKEEASLRAPGQAWDLPPTTACQACLWVWQSGKGKIPTYRIRSWKQVSYLGQSTEECDHCTDLRANLMKLNWNHTVLQRESHQLESRGIIGCVSYSLHRKLRNWVSVDCLKSTSPPSTILHFPGYLQLSGNTSKCTGLLQSPFERKSHKSPETLVVFYFWKAASNYPVKWLNQQGSMVLHDNCEGSTGCYINILLPHPGH